MIKNIHTDNKDKDNIQNYYNEEFIICINSNSLPTEIASLTQG